MVRWVVVRIGRCTSVALQVPVPVQERTGDARVDLGYSHSVRLPTTD